MVLLAFVFLFRNVCKLRTVFGRCGQSSKNSTYRWCCHRSPLLLLWKTTTDKTSSNKLYFAVPKMITPAMHKQTNKQTSTHTHDRSLYCLFNICGEKVLVPPSFQRRKMKWEMKGFNGKILRKRENPMESEAATMQSFDCIPKHTYVHMKRKK